MCECTSKQNFNTCNCVGLFRISYTYKDEPLITIHKFKDITNFKRWAELNNLPHKEFKNIELVT